MTERQNIPTDSVRIVIFNTDNTDEFLIVEEADDKGGWKLPGGKFDDPSETPDDAAARELQEELGVSAETVALQQAGQLTHNDGVSARYIYRGSAALNALQPSDEIAASKWASEDTLPDTPNSHHIKTAVQLARTL